RPDVPAAEIDAAMGALVTAQLVDSDGRLYTLASQSARAALISSVGPATEHHAALATLYEGRLTFGVVRHALLARQEGRALDGIGALLADVPERSALFAVADISPSEMAATFAQALDAAERIGRPPREINELRRWLVSISVIGEAAYFLSVGPVWLEQLKVDS